MTSLLRANLSSILFAAKIVILIAVDYMSNVGADYFGQYSLATVLTSSFFIFAGMHGRVFVLSSNFVSHDFGKFNSLIVILGLLAFCIVFLLNKDSHNIALIALISGVKFIENIIDANTSYIQLLRGRDLAFSLFNWRGMAVLIAYGLMVPLIGLQYAVAGEVVISIAFAWCQRRVIAGAVAHLRLEKQTQGMQGIFRSASWFTLCATLNSAITAFIIYAMTYLGDGAYYEDAIFFAKVVAIQSMISRVMLPNNVFFRKEIAKYIRYAKSSISVFSVAISLSLMIILVVMFYSPADERNASLIVLAVMFTLINVVNLLLRQNLLFGYEIMALIRLHSIEFIFMCMFVLLFGAEGIYLIACFTLLRAVRVFYMNKLLLREEGE